MFEKTWNAHRDRAMGCERISPTINFCGFPFVKSDRTTYASSDDTQFSFQLECGQQPDGGLERDDWYKTQPAPGFLSGC